MFAQIRSEDRVEKGASPLGSRPVGHEKSSASRWPSRRGAVALFYRFNTRIVFFGRKVGVFTMLVAQCLVFVRAAFSRARRPCHGALVVLFLVAAGCSKPPAGTVAPSVTTKFADAPKFAEAIERERVAKTGLFDAREFPRFADADAAKLATLTHLVDVNLDNAPITNAAVNALQPLAELRRLSLSNTGVTDEGLQNLRNFARLEFVRLDSTRVGDKGMAHLAAIPNLRELSLWRVVVTDNGVAHLQNASRLEHISLDGTPVGDGALAALGRLGSLKWLQLWKTAVTDAGLAHLRGHAALEKLVLNETAVTDAGIDQLAGLPRLRSLSLQGTRVTKEAAMRLKASRPGLEIDQ